MTLDDLAAQAHFAAEGLLDCALDAVRNRVSEHGKLSADRLEAEQRAAHGLAWLATYVEAIKEMAAYAKRMREEGRFGQTEQLLTRIGLGEYLAQSFSAIPMNQGEIVRLADFGLEPHDITPFRNEVVEALIASGNTRENRAALAAVIREAPEGAIGDPGLDETFEAIRGEMRRFADAEVAPHAQGWHRANAYIPLEIIAGLSQMGVFGLTIPEAYGGMGLGKVAMCVVSEELSRGYIGVGSLGTRSEIAAELILVGGTEAQKQKYLPGIASGAILPTAVFTEPNTGSDLASLRTRATRDGDAYVVSGAKTWITHPVRADLMTLLVRTNPDQRGYRGLSMFLAEKPRGTDADPFPAKGMSGRRDRSARLSRHEGIRDRLRRLPPARRGAARGGGRPGLQAIDGDLRIGAHPDGRARRGGRPMRLRAWPALREGADAVRQDDHSFPPRRRQARDDGGRDPHRPPDRLLRRPRQG